MREDHDRRRHARRVDDAADRVRAVQRGAGAAHHLDAARLRQVHLVEGVVVEEARRADRNAVLKKQIQRAKTCAKPIVTICDFS